MWRYHDTGTHQLFLAASWQRSREIFHLVESVLAFQRGAELRGRKWICPVHFFLTYVSDEQASLCSPEIYERVHGPSGGSVSVFQVCVCFAIAGESRPTGLVSLTPFPEQRFLVFCHHFCLSQGVRESWSECWASFSDLNHLLTTRSQGANLSSLTETAPK